MDGVDTRVLWSERAVGIQGYGTKEENPQTLFFWVNFFLQFFVFFLLFF